MNTKVGVLLINLGTPDSIKVKDVRRYLSEFLNDPRVIDIPWLLRKFLVNIIIVPFRARNSSKLYKQLWTKDGSPLLTYGQSVKEKLQLALSENYEVELAMRYQNPSLYDVLERMKTKNYSRIIIISLFPQYASASSGSAIEKAIEIIGKWWVIPAIKIAGPFFNNEGFVNAFVERAKNYDIKDYDHVLFSFHGLPVRQVEKVHNNKTCSQFDCENELNENNFYCYKAECYATARTFAQRLNIPQENYTVCFQSRLTKDWLKPFTDEVIIQMAKEGKKKLLAFSPAFVADCLETNVEIGIEYKKLFEEHGGEKIQLVESLNDHPAWIAALKDIVLKA